MLTHDLKNEKELLILAAQADEGALTTLFHLYKNKLYAYLFRLTESDTLSEDIVQDVFMKLWNDRQTLSSIDNFGSYLFRMSKNHAINYFKRMAQETLIMAEMYGRNSYVHNETQDIIALKDVEKLLNEILERLPAQQKIVYHLSREEGRTHDEIANLLKISPNTVKNHIVQAMSTIRTQLRMHADTMLLVSIMFALKK